MRRSRAVMVLDWVEDAPGFPPPKQTGPLEHHKCPIFITREQAAAVPPPPPPHHPINITAAVSMEPN